MDFGRAFGATFAGTPVPCMLERGRSTPEMFSRLSVSRDMTPERPVSAVDWSFGKNCRGAAVGHKQSVAAGPEHSIPDLRPLFLPAAIIRGRTKVQTRLRGLSILLILQIHTVESSEAQSPCGFPAHGYGMLYDSVPC